MQLIATVNKTGPWNHEILRSRHQNKQNKATQLLVISVDETVERGYSECQAALFFKVVTAKAFIRLQIKIDFYFSLPRKDTYMY